MSYDAESDLWYCADVGQGAREEVNIVKRGNNYGWAYREGTMAGPKSGSAPTGFASADPIIEYGHTNGGFGTRIAIIGGLGYRGIRLPDLTGWHVYGDYGSGEIWAVHYDGTIASAPQLLLTDAGVAACGSDPRNGDILYAVLQSGNDSVIKRIVSANPIPFIRSITLAGSEVVISGIRGTLAGTYQVLSSTNIALPLNLWTRLAIYTYDALGNFAFTNPISDGVSPKYFRLQMP